MQGLEGLFKCNIHNESFNSLDEFNDHIAKQVHVHTGLGKCQDCGKPNQEIIFEGTLEAGKSPPAICKKCQDSYIAELEAKGLVKKVEKKEK